MFNHGLSSAQIDTIKTILRPYACDITEVCLFGSRANGTYRPCSDIDLVLKGSLTEKTLDHLWTLFAESSLPYKVDVKGYHLIAYPPLKRHIETVMQVLLTQQDLCL
jgi:predicted nucleotidyltransferase